MKNLVLSFVAVIVSASLSSQQNEIGITTDFRKSGISYEHFVSNHFSIGSTLGTGLYAYKSDEPLVLFSKAKWTREQRAIISFSPFLRYYFKNQTYSGLFLTGHMMFSTVDTKKYADNVLNWSRKLQYYGPALGIGYKFNLSTRSRITVFASMGYDLGNNDLVPVFADGLLTYSYKF